METAASRLSSFWRSARGRRALAALALAILVVAAVAVTLRDGDEERDARREAVSTYIGRVNQTQQLLVGELDEVGRTYRELRLQERTDPKQLARLDQAERTLRDLHTRLAAVPAPPEARRLRTLLLRLVRLQTDLAAEVGGIARYLPVHAAETRAVGKATLALQRGLRAAETAADQRAAFAAYDAAIRGAVADLGRADAPRVLAPARRRELDRVRELSELSRRLRAALAAGRATDVDRLFRRFLVVNASVGTTRAERDAVVAFNRRVASIAEQRKAVSVERARLDRALR